MSMAPKITPKEQERRQKISKTQSSLWEERKKAQEEAKLIQSQMMQRIGSISAFRDPFKNEYVMMNPGVIRSLLSGVKTGYLQPWADFCDWMLDYDAHIRGLVDIRIKSITGKKAVIQPANNTPEAKAAADFIREEWQNIPELDRTIRQMLMATFKGVSLNEIIWKVDPIDYTWRVKEIIPIMARKIQIRLNPVTPEGEEVITKVTTGYGKYVYTYWNQGDNNYGAGMNVEEIFPGKYICHSPGDEDLLHYRGLFRSLSFLWFFKMQAITYWVAGIEKYAFPVVYAKVPRTMESASRYNLVTNLNNLQSDAAAVFDEDVTIDTIAPSTNGGDGAWKQFVDWCNQEISKLLLGGTLSVQADTTGANRALGEVHERTREDLIQADAAALAETIRQQLFRYMLEHNAHKFGGVVPPIPTIEFDVILKDYQPIAQMHIDAGVVTNNEVRAQLGLPLWTEEEGGNRIAQISPGAGLSSDEQALMSITNGENLQEATTYYVGKKKKGEPS